jgi:hypothetical protein
MTRDEVFDEIYQVIETKLSDIVLNPYSATILSYIPSYEFDDLPLIVLSQIDYRLVGEALNKNEKRHEIVIEAQIFARNEQGVHQRVIGNNVANIVEDVIQNDYGLGLEMSNVIPNLDESIYRIVLRFRGYTFDDTKVIYRNN